MIDGAETPARIDGNDLILLCRVQPRASREGLDGLHDGRYRLRVNAPALEGRANSAVQKLIAHLCDCPARDVHVEAGLRSRNKRVRVVGVNELPAAFAAVMPGS